MRAVGLARVRFCADVAVVVDRVALTGRDGEVDDEVDVAEEVAEEAEEETRCEGSAKARLR